MIRNGTVSNADNATVGAIKKPKSTNKDEKQLRLAVGSLGERYGLDSIKAINIPKDFKEQVELCRKLYKDEGVVKTVIDLMVDFSVTGMQNVTPYPRVKQFFDSFCRNTNMDALLRSIFFEYYMSGDVFIYRGDKQIVKHGPDKGSIYYPYTVLNPTAVNVEGSLMFGEEIYTLKWPKELDIIFSDRKKYASIINSLPKEFRNPKRVKTTGDIILDKNRVSRITRNKQPYQRRPQPFLSGAFAPLLLKQRLREMDLSTAEGTINHLQVIKVGSDKFPATKGQIKAIAELFSTGAKSYQLFWNHTLEVEDHYANFDALSEEKYAQINRDVYNSLGMPIVLINGTDAGNFANAWASIVALEERLEGGRRPVRRWLESEYVIIAEENNIKNVPKVKFDRINLKEEKTFKNLLLAYYDRGLLDKETVLHDSDFDYEQIKRNKEMEEEDAPLFISPYQGGGLAQVPVAPKAPAAPKPKTVKPGGEGRPITEVSPQYTERAPQETPKSTSEPELTTKKKSGR